MSVECALWCRGDGEGEGEGEGELIVDAKSEELAGGRMMLTSRGGS